MDRSGKKGGFHPADATIFAGQTKANYLDLKESIRVIPLARLIVAASKDLGLKVSNYWLTEYLGASGTADIAGAAYLIPDKIYDICFQAAYMTDLVPLASNLMDCPGSTLKIDGEIDGQFNAKYFGGGGEMPTETKQIGKVEITPKLFGIRPEINNELIEDSQFDLIEMHLRNAARAMGEFSTWQFLDMLMSEHAVATTCGLDGVLNAVLSGGGWCYNLDILEAEGENAKDGFASDVIIWPPEGPENFLSAQALNPDLYSDWFHTQAMQRNPMEWPELFGMKNYRTVHELATDCHLYADENWHTWVLNKENATATVRKRWLKIENYSDPVRDLVGATITSRQDCDMIYRDAACVIDWAAT